MVMVLLLPGSGVILRRCQNVTICAVYLLLQPCQTSPGQGVCCARGARGASALGEEPRALGAWGDTLSHTPIVCYLVFVNPN